MLHPRLSSWLRSLALLTAMGLAAGQSFAQQEKLPDAPSPQNNAPASVQSPDNGDQGSSSSDANTEAPPNTRQSGAQQSQPGTNQQPPPPGSQEIKTVPSGSAPKDSQSGRDELFRLQVAVNFVTVPVTVKDQDTKLVDGLLANDFSIYEDGAPQRITFFTSDPFPLSTALVIDQGMPDQTLRKINQTFSALGGAFGPFDEVAVFTYGTSVNKRQDFGNATRMEMALQRIREERGQNNGASVVGGPFGAGPQTNSKPMPGSPITQTPSKEAHVLNDAILMAAQELSHRPRQNRKIIFVISDGQEYESRASYAQVLKVLLTNEIAVYAIGVDRAAIPVYNKIEKARIPGFGYSDILPRYANASGGDVLDEFSKEAIESAYQRITAEARNQYTLGYNTPQKLASNYREIEVRVKRPGLLVYAKRGYYPLPPKRDVQQASSDQAAPDNNTPASQQPQ